MFLYAPHGEYVSYKASTPYNLKLKIQRDVETSFFLLKLNSQSSSQKERRKKINNFTVI